MNTTNNVRNGSRIQLDQHQAARTAIMSLLLLLLTLPAALQAQFTYTSNNGAITITGYTGPGGDVTIPDTINGLPVTSIRESAFYLCGLTSLTIGTNLTSFAAGALGGNTSLIAITVDALNPAYSSVDGILFNKSQTTLIQYPLANAGTVTIPNSVTTIGDYAFWLCTMTSVTIPDSVISIGHNAFLACMSLTNVTIGNGVTSIVCVFGCCVNLTSVTIPNSVTNIGDYAFGECYRLASVVIPNSVTSIGDGAFGSSGLAAVTIPDSVTTIGDWAFSSCGSLTGVFFQGNTPSLSGYVFSGDNNATVYYLPGTTGWGTTFGGLPAMLWNPPTIQRPLQSQTAEAGSAVGLRTDASGSSPLFYLWYLNSTNLLSCSTNCELDLTNLQLSQSGAYTVVVTNAAGAVTSAPALLNVIAAVERRPVPGVKVAGESAGLWNVDSADSLIPAPNWIALGSVTLTSTPQYCFDLALSPPPQRFYRTWQTGTPGVRSSLDLHLVPAMTLTGSIGHSVRLDYINQFGPIDAWVTLATVPLTNTSQLYFDISAPGQPPRLYRVVQIP